MHKISVAMAVYNGACFLEPQLDSILADLEAQDELVISYDESTDSTWEIICRYAEEYPQIKLVRDPGKGVFSNFENAIRNTTGDYIFISDQDDLWVRGKRQRVLEDFDKTGADMVIHNLISIDAEGREISGDFFSSFHIRNGLVRNFLMPRYSGCGTAFRAEWKQRLLPIPRGVGAYDHWLGMMGEVYGKVYFDDAVLLRHRLHGDNVTVSRRDLGTILRVRGRLLRELIKRGRR